MSLNELAFNHFKNFYYREIERRDSIYKSLSLPVGIIVILAGSAKYVLSQWQVLTNICMQIVFLVLIAISIFFTLRAVYYLIRVIVGYGYNYISLPHEVLEYQSELTQYYEGLYISTKSREYIDDLVKKDLSLFLADQYARYGSTNAMHNDDKSEFRYKAHLSIVASLVFIGGCFILVIGYKYCVPFGKTLLSF